MKPTLQELYNYIFRNNWANPEYGIADSVKPEARQKQINSRKTKMKNLFEEAIPAHERMKFRTLLRHCKATHLEAALYNNTTDHLTEKYELPDIAKIHNEFEKLESKHHYFEEKENLITFQKFHALFLVSKIIADFIEHNNNYQDEVAFQHAYKALVIFGDQDTPENYFKTLDKYLTSHNFINVDHPLHDALVWELPLNTRTTYLSQWRKIIHETGTKAFRLFAQASAIGEKLQQPPKDFIEAIKTAHSLAYKSSAEDPELATLFMHYNLSEIIFNQALKLKPIMKKTDNLPTIVIRGEDIGNPRYYLFKLPIDDPRAFILGHITNCCQSLGGHSEMCVIDGVSRPNNGFLVLVKDRFRVADSKKAEAREPHAILTEKEIDIKKLLSHCKIMGQGYTWLSKAGNITIDSWENLNPKAEDDIAVDMLRQYANAVINQPGSRIIRVTIGEGGKTPKNVSENREVLLHTEHMLEGEQYGDSMFQTCIAMNEKFTADMTAQMKMILPDYDDRIIQFLTQPQVGYSYFMKSALEVEHFRNYLADKANFRRLTVLFGYHGSDLWRLFIILAEANLVTSDNIDSALGLKYFIATEFATILIHLQKANLLNQEMLNYLFSPEFHFESALGRSKPFTCFMKVLISISDAGQLNRKTLNFILLNLRDITIFSTHIESLRQSQIPITEKVMNFIIEYTEGSQAAIKTLSQLTEKTLPNIFEHIYKQLIPTDSKDETTKPIQISSYKEFLKKTSKMKVNFLSDAIFTLIGYLGDPHTIPYQIVTIYATQNGNINLLKTLFDICTPEISLFSIFSHEQNPENADLLLRKTFGMTYDDLINDINFYIFHEKNVLEGLEGYTFLMLNAAENRHLDVVNFLLENGADKQLALKFAISKKLFNAVDLLLNEAKANINNSRIPSLICQGEDPQLFKILLNSCAESFFKILPEAAGQHTLPLIKILLAAKAPVDYPSPNFGETALAIAVKYAPDKELVNMLLEAKADVNCIIKTSTGKHYSIMDCAVYGGNPEIIEILVKQGAKVDVVNSEGITLLQMTINGIKEHYNVPRPDFVKKLLELGAPSDLTQYQDITKSSLYQSCIHAETKKVLEEFHANYMKKNPLLFSEQSTTATFFSGNKSAATVDQAKQVITKKL